jgi:hypothetical protein
MTITVIDQTNKKNLTFLDLYALEPPAPGHIVILGGVMDPADLTSVPAEVVGTEKRLEVTALGVKNRRRGGEMLRSRSDESSRFALCGSGENVKERFEPRSTTKLGTIDRPCCQRWPLPEVEDTYERTRKKRVCDESIGKIRDPHAFDAKVTEHTWRVGSHTAIYVDDLGGFLA